MLCSAPRAPFVTLHGGLLVATPVAFAIAESSVSAVALVLALELGAAVWYRAIRTRVAPVSLRSVLELSKYPACVIVLHRANGASLAEWWRVGAAALLVYGSFVVFELSHDGRVALREPVLAKNSTRQAPGPWRSSHHTSCRGAPVAMMKSSHLRPLDNLAQLRPLDIPGLGGIAGQ